VKKHSPNVPHVVRSGVAAARHRDRLAALSAAHEALQRARSARTAALVQAYEHAMKNAVTSHGPGSDDRSGPFAREFLVSAAETLRLSPGEAGRLLDAARSRPARPSEVA
jgi:hypothetical protein